MSESAEAVAASQKSSRNITIEIVNYTRNYCLIDPDIFLESGSVFSPPQPTVRPMRTEVCNFSKDRGASGVVGVLTYDLFQRGKGAKEKVALMFSVPVSYSGYQNWFALGLYPKDKEVNKELYTEMYYKEKKEGETQLFLRMEATGSGLTFEGCDVDIKATMSPMGRAIVKMEVWDKLFSPPRSQGNY